MNKINHVFNIVLFVFSMHFGHAQTGPGGVGSSSNLVYWIDASRLGLGNGASVQTITDFSGNTNDISQNTVARQGIYNTSSVNGKAAISFDGVDDFYATSNTTPLSGVGATSVFSVNTYLPSPTVQNLFNVRLPVSNSGFSIFKAGTVVYHTAPTSSSYAAVGRLLQAGFNLTSSIWNSATPSLAARLNSGTSGTNATANGILSGASRITFGKLSLSNSRFFSGLLAEFILMSQSVNSTQQIIIENYLAAKYDLTISNDKFSFQATHGSEVAGIGQEALGDNHIDAQGTSIVRIQAASDLGTGEYLMWGHDGGGITADAVEIPASFGGSGAKLTQEWVADETGGDVGTVDIIFDMAGISTLLGLDLTNLRILTDSDDDFTNANTNNAIAPVVVGNVVTFNDVDLSTEMFFSIANTGNSETCVSDFGSVSASWSTVGEWDCATFPDSTKDASIVSPHIRIVSDTQSVNNLDIETGASVVVNANATLIINGNLSIANTGTLICDAGSNVIFRGTAGSTQLVDNSSGGNQAFANVQISNANNVEFSGGSFSISEGLHLINGSFQNNSSLTFTSDAASQGHVARVVAGDFTGSSGVFTIERFKTGGTAGWNDLASAGISTTVSDLDNEIYISGVVGGEGGASAAGGGSFISMYTYDNVADDYTPVTNVTNPMGLGQGFETWLGDNLTTWNAKAWNFTGSSINVATTNIPVNASGSRWNLIGNPLPGFLDFSSVLSNFIGIGMIIGNEFWYFDADSNQYNSRGAGAFIPPGQGFWINVLTASELTIDPTTDLRSDLNTSEWFKNTPKEEFRVKVTNQENSFASSVYLRKDYMAFSGVDELDLQPLKVPDSRAVNMWMDYAGEESMVNYIDPSEEHLEVPLTIKSGIPGEFIMNFQGLNKFEEFQCKNLLNLETNEQIEIVPGASYSFEVGEDLDPLNFKLLLSKSDYEDCLAPTEFTNNDIRVFSNGKTIVADFFLDRSVEAKIEVYNMLGQTVYGNTSTIGYSRESINLTNVKTGVFFVNININGTNKTEKVILK